MAARITPLRLEAFEQLPKHARRCVYWEVDPPTLSGGDDHLSDPEFEKEAWLSMVMLEWGSCGQLAVHCSDREAAAAEATPCAGVTGHGGRTVSGLRLLCPAARRAPGASVPDRAGQRRRGTAHVARCRVRARGSGLPRNLIAAVVADLVRRGVRALEAFGRTAEVSELFDPAWCRRISHPS